MGTPQVECGASNIHAFDIARHRSGIFASFGIRLGGMRQAWILLSGAPETNERLLMT
jgi:hypothetical protein